MLRSMRILRKRRENVVSHAWTPVIKSVQEQHWTEMCDHSRFFTLFFIYKMATTIPTHSGFLSTECDNICNDSEWCPTVRKCSVIFCVLTYAKTAIVANYTI